MNADTLREVVARAIREAPMRATGVKPDPEIPLTDGEMLRGDAALQAIVQAAGLDAEGLRYEADRLEKQAKSAEVDGLTEVVAPRRRATVALLRALASAAAPHP